MAAATGKLARGLFKLGLRLFVPLMIIVSILACVNFSAIISAIQHGRSSMPSVPSVSQATLSRAADSQAGQKLRPQGYTATTTIQDPDVISWLNGLEKSASLSNPGPYVVFTEGMAEPNQPDPNVPPDMIIDANYGVIVAAQQAFSDHRGAICYNATDIRMLATPTVWVAINMYLWNKGLGEPFTLTENQVPQLPAGTTTVQCRTFAS